MTLCRTSLVVQWLRLCATKVGEPRSCMLRAWPKKQTKKKQKKTWHHKTPRRERKQNILRHKSYQCFLRSVSQGNRNKDKNKQMGPDQSYKLFPSKGNHRNIKLKRQPTEWKDICKQGNPKGLHFQNIQTDHLTQQQKNKQPSWKMDWPPE